MNITPQDIRHLEGLSRIQIEPAEEAALIFKAEEILTYFAAIDSLELAAETDKTAQETSNRLREDIPSPCMGREKLLQNAPEQRDGFFVVPNVMEQG